MVDGDYYLFVVNSMAHGYHQIQVWPLETLVAQTAEYAKVEAN